MHGWLLTFGTNRSINVPSPQQYHGLFGDEQFEVVPAGVLLTLRGRREDRKEEKEMKKLAAIACLLVLVLSTAVMAADDDWALFLDADDGAGGNKGTKMAFGVKPAALDGWDTSDGPEAAMAISQPSTKWATGKIGDLVYSRDYMSTALPISYPGYGKIWEFRVAGLSGADTTTPIRLQFSTTITALRPPDWWRWVRMVDNQDVAGAPANGTKWLIPSIPTTAGTVFLTITLPTVRLTSGNTSAAMINEGYAMEFVHPVPEPGSLLALACGLGAIGGMMRRRRR